MTRTGESPHAMTEEGKVGLYLTNDEALVLLDFLLRFNQESEAELVDPAEKFVLWGVECMLEQQLREPFDPNYSELVLQARRAVRESY
ncbi:MAG: hypothetical protein FJX76_17130 [Armatimonadetes bacterium]|nr:hypothetical protein [Armatimonadota bacterium]